MQPVELCGGEISAWFEPGGPICIKAVTEHGDPVEMSADDASRLVAMLQDFIKRLDH